MIERLSDDGASNNLCEDQIMNEAFIGKKQWK